MSSGGLDSSVTLDEVFTVLGTRRVPLAPELAGYLVLELAEHADPGGGDVDPRSVFVSDEGTVALVKPRREAAAGDAEASVRALLARLLEASGAHTPALAAASKRKSGPGLPALAEELETALIPVNRAAGRRALARLAREVRRVTLGVGRNAFPSSADALPPRRASQPSHPSATPAPPPAEPAPRAPAPPAADAPPHATSRPPPSFPRDEDPTSTRAKIPDEVIGGALPIEENEPAPARLEPTPATPMADVDELIADFAVSGGGEQQHARALKAMAGLEPTPPPAGRASIADGGVESLLATGEPSRRADAPPPRDARQLPTGASQVRRSRGAEPPRRGAGSTAAIFLAAAAVAGGGYAAWHLRPREPVVRAPVRAAAAPARPAGAPAPACRATLVVTDVPPRAEVLLHAGQAPVDVEKMPVGARLEFVATAEGYAPKRVVIPAAAAWDRGADGKPRFEAAVQLDRSSARPAGRDPWPPAEPGSAVGGQGPPGTVHVVATPRGAEVWMLAGIGPEARIEQLRCDRDLDVLVAGPTTYRKRLRVRASDFAIQPGGGAKAATRVARVSAK